MISFCTVKFMVKKLTVNGIAYRVVQLLGKGKGGYSWLAERDGRQAVIKQIHYVPCGYAALETRSRLNSGTMGGCKKMEPI